MKKKLMLRLLSFIWALARLVDGIVGVLTLGVCWTSLPLRAVKNLAEYQFEFLNDK